MNPYYVYIVGDGRRRLSVGATANLVRRIYELKHGLRDDWAVSRGLARLLYYELQPDRAAALLRLQALKQWPRRKKHVLIRLNNPHWKDLSGEFLGILPAWEIMQALWL